MTDTMQDDKQTDKTTKAQSDGKMAKAQGDGKMTVQEAGHLGGEATSQTHDRSFYEEIGSEGGKVSPGNFKHDPARAKEAGSHSHDNDAKRDE